MLLTLEDIQHIQKIGYEYEFFVRESNGWLRLRNDKGLCVFHDGLLCRIYEYRPEGCRLYPVVFNKDEHQAKLDTDCPQKQFFSLTTDLVMRLRYLVSTLQYERRARKKQKSTKTK